MKTANPQTLLTCLIVVAVLCVSAAGSAYLLWPSANPPAAPASASLDTSAPTPAPAPTSRPGVVPSFDIVRIGPRGAALVGRAEPGATVIVVNNNAKLGQAQADGRGEWMLVSATSLAPGGRELSLSARTADGRDVKGDGAVLLDVPASLAASDPVTALLVPQLGESRVLQGAPDDTTQKSEQKPDRRSERKLGARLVLNAVDYDERRVTRLAGQAPPGAVVRAYVDEALAGDAAADVQGRWAMVPQRALSRGMHRLRVDQLDGDGQVLARVELPFKRVAPPAAPTPGRAVVQPGQTLWRLARQAYGTGVRYTVIYLANRDQIRDPRLIYPGQTFTIPVTVR